MTSFVRTVMALPPAPGAPRRVWRDWVLVGLFMALALFEGAVRIEVAWLFPAVLIQLGAIVALLWRRSHPGVVAVVVFGSSAGFDIVRLLAGIAPISLYSSAFALIVLYALVRWGSGRDLLVGGAVFAVGSVVSFAFSADLPGDLIGGLAVIAIPVTLGALVRNRAVARVERLEQVRLLERERLARDLHDTVAHHVSAIAMRAQAGLAAGDATGDALREIEAEATVTLREMRSLVGVLREDATGLRSPSAGADDLRALESSRGPVPVRVRIDGDIDSLPAPLVAAIYRIAQESVTNARNHADGATAIDVVVTVTAAAASVRVHDDGRGAGRRASTAGFGIIGIAERADLLGGAFTAGWDPAGGWTVEATLPVGAA